MSNEIITVAQMRAVDAAAAARGAPTLTLMENAGRAVAEAIVRRFAPRRTAVVCGPGNNGGDGWVAARLLRDMGWPVAVTTLVPRDALKDEAAAAAQHWLGDVSNARADGLDAELYVDAMFGAGLSRPLEGEAARIAAFMATISARVVAIDVPSGLDGDTGKPRGNACASAALTVTFVRKKPGHVLLPGRALCGEVVVADIGAPESAVMAQQARLFENGPHLWRDRFPWPGPEAHKHARGHVMIASGPHARTGAARLAARAALRVGAGLVTVLSPDNALAENAAHLTAIMLRPANNADDFADAVRSAQCLAIGPAFGVDQNAREKLEAAIGAKDRCAAVIDADAISLLAPLKRTMDPRDVLTPHVGEFRRAFPGVLETQPSRIEAARAAAAQVGCTVLLKGPDTIVAGADARAVVNTTGTPFLATAGAGDALTGLISGLIAQGMKTFEAAAAAAWLHGRCAEAYGPGLIAEDIAEILPRVLSALAGLPSGVSAAD
ncbi:MAG: NAD(P)H-hydrate dehydratase [Proteobacteria bacterium]|nr:NAD(P)H-hydrate dehydratase [Pseudomonadota bacterium]